MNRNFAILTWAYLVELLLVGLIYGEMLLQFGHEQLVSVIRSHWQVFCTIALSLFGASIAALIYFAQSLESDFGKYLYWCKADGHYMRSYKVQSLLSFLAVIMPLVVIFGNNAVAVHVAWVISLYAWVNVVTVVQNTVGLVRLRQKFRSEHDAIVAEMTKKQK